MSNRRNAPPKASAMIEALRGLGYTTASALADVVDNSIAAGATNIDVQFQWSGAASWVTVLDDGCGMSDAELDLAMRLGERNPLHDRAVGDLGRFGLGLKTASFSQCRRLTVASTKGGQTSCLRWDLDVIANSEDDGWHLLEGAHFGSESMLDTLEPRKHGTMVLWEVLDRVVTSDFGKQDFLDLIDHVERHLAMVFHRFLDGSSRKLAIRINNQLLLPWDPFLASHAATWSSPIVALGGGVSAQGFVLPHQDRLTPKEYQSGAGPDGWTSQQGIYVYRNRRLLVAGSWLGLGRGRSWTKEEAHRLARLRVDIPNSADADWKIDIRKSTARAPLPLRERLIRLSEDTRDRARRVFAHRGQRERPGATDAVAQAWRAEHFSGGVRYRIDRDHPVVRAVLDEAGDLAVRLSGLLRVLEETIPVQRIWLDTAEATETPRTGFAGESPSAVQEILLVFFRNLVVRKGFSPESARKQLLQTEPFNCFPEMVMALPDDLYTSEME